MLASPIFEKPEEQIKEQGKECPPELDREALLPALRGQTIKIPNLRPLYKEWPFEVNPLVEENSKTVNKWMESFISPGKMLDSLVMSNFGLFGATWWPYSPSDRLKICTYHIIWLFIWDDEIDSAAGSMWKDFEGAQKFREETLAYIRFTLGLSDVEVKPASPVILAYKEIGEAVRQVYSQEKREILYQEMKFFVQMCQKEQELRLSGAIPSLDEFWKYRLGSSAVTVCLAMHEFSFGDMDLPSAVLTDTDIQLVRRGVNTTICAVNDLLSLKKEIERKAIDSLVPILYYYNHDMQGAVQEVVCFISSEIAAFDDAVQNIRTRYALADDKMKDELERYIEGCKYNSTGNLAWRPSLTTKRYNVDAADKGGAITVEL